jgi:carbohydrate-binding DOMON domain-containing protein
LALRDGDVLSCNPLLEIDPERCTVLVSASGDIVEIAVPLTDLGALAPGDVVLLKATVDGSLVPADGPLGLQVPDISDVDVFLEFEDPEGDDHGPGGYLYPTDTVFAGGSYDLTRFSAGTEKDDLVLQFEVLAPIGNPWGSPSGLSVQTFDVYIDTDPGAGTGARFLIDGRNAVMPQKAGWEYGLTIEGWQPALYVSDDVGNTEETEPSTSVAVFGDQGKVVVRIPLSLLGNGDPSTWEYGVVVLSQEGFPSPGVRRVRDIDLTPSQWRGGGAPSDINHTRIYDMIGPEGAESSLADYSAVTSGTIDDLVPEDFGQIVMVGAQ